MSEDTSPAPVEALKRQSRHLRGSIAAEITSAASALSEESASLLKFHGSYQQFNRDTATRLKRLGLEKDYSFMVRLRLPGGRLTAAQYLALEALAARYGDKSLRITTRQSFQFYGVVKKELKAFLADINELHLTTLGACGDVVRNVVTTPAPIADVVHRRLEEDARRISQTFLPQTRAYAELWLDGEPVALGADAEEEPLYGATYLPRKFKIALAVPEDNSTDVLTNDLAIIALHENGILAGYNLALGGGLGMTHNNPRTYPHLAQPVFFVAPDELLAAVAAVIELQRDQGDRANRKHARLKYLVAERGVPWIKRALETRLGHALADPRPHPPLRVPDLLGWHDQKDGRFWYGLPVPSGRISDGANGYLRAALREIVSRFSADPVLTPDQNILLANLPADAKDEIERIAEGYGVALADRITPIERWSLACPALPSCGLALTEAERVKENVTGAIDAVLGACGLARERITIRITGCPNGCARPYAAEIGLVGRMPGHYKIFVGGAFEGTRLGFELIDKVALADVAAVLAPLFECFARERGGGEAFGDFCARQQPDRLRRLAQGARPLAVRERAG